MTHAIHFLSEALKYVPTSLCHYQLASIEAVRAIFANRINVDSYSTVPPIEIQNRPKPIVPFPKPSPLRYPELKSKSDHGKDSITTSKGAFKQQTPVIPKGRQVLVNSKVDQEPIAARTRSRVSPSSNLSPFKAQIQLLDELVQAQTRYRTVSQNYTNT